MSAVVLLLILLVPFNAPVLAVWGRNVWADYRNTFPGDYDALRIAPLSLLTMTCLSGRPIKLDNKCVVSMLDDCRLLTSQAYLDGDTQVDSGHTFSRCVCIRRSADVDNTAYC